MRSIPRNLDLVLTDRMIYDFSIPRHVDYFRDEVDRSWKFYESQILIRANELRDRARSKGLYTGGPLTIGYFVDKNPKSATYMKIIPYQLHAPRTLEIFQWLYDCGGILGVLKDRLDSLPYVWPIEEEWVRQQKAFWTNLEVVYGVEVNEEGKPIPIGYRISPHGLKLLLGNRVLRGDWPYDGDWIEGNHEAIVPKDLFEFAQQVLEENRRGVAETANYHTPTTSVIHDILFPGPEDAKKRYINVNRKQEQYSIEEQRGMKRAVLAKVSMWDKDYEERLKKDEQNKKIEGKKKNLQEALHDLNERIDGLFLTLQSPKLKPGERDEYIEERSKLMRRREAIENEMKIRSPIQVYLKYKDLIDKMGKFWERYPFEDRQALVALLVRRVYLEPLSHYYMQITIEWKEFPADVGIIWRRKPSSLHWIPEEDQRLREKYPTEPPQAILEALPHRSWVAIQTRASKLPVRRSVKMEFVGNPSMSLEDLAVMECFGITEEDLAKTLFTRWV
jgi:hypothetical protein